MTARRSVTSLLLAAMLVLGLVITSLPAGAQEFDIPSVTISGGDLPHTVELAPADADAFRRRVNQLPRFEDTPDAEGTRYVVTTSYWAVAVRLEEEESPLDVSVRGDYYPTDGYVRVTLEDEEEGETEDIWMILSLRQRAILDRYIRLTNEGLLTEQPSSMAVLAAAASDEVFGVEAAAEPVPAETAAELLTTLSEANPAPFLEERDAPLGGDEGFWLTITLLEGRALRYYYADGALTESLGTERYDASAVADLLAAITPDAPPLIVEEDPAGSLLWWPVMIGGGLTAIGAGVWLHRRNQTSSQAAKTGDPNTRKVHS